MAELRQPADHRGAEAQGLGSEPQAGAAADARRQLLCLRKRQFVVTTDSQHGLAVYGNWASSMVLTGVDQLGVADLTYLRLAEEFVYLAVVPDAYSRRVIGWELDRTLEDITDDFGAPPGVGATPGGAGAGARTIPTGAFQYAGGAYIELLQQHQIQISMRGLASFWRRSTTPSGHTRRWTTCRRWSSSARCGWEPNRRQ